MSVIKLITSPTEEPVSLVEAKAHLRVDDIGEDTLIQALIISARQEAEKITRRALLPQTWEYVLDAFPCQINLPLPTLQTVENIKYIDTSGVEQTLDPLAYQVDADSEPARIIPTFGYLWPVTLNQLNAVRIRYSCGYADVQSVPAAIKQWILIRVATLYENRESVNVGGTVTDFGFINGLLDEYRVMTF